MAFSKIAAENLGGSTLPALAGGSLTGVGGLTEVDTWRLTTTFSGEQNWGSMERVDTDASGHIGTGLTYSSPYFSFPSTGYYLLQATANFHKQSSGQRVITLRIHFTTDNSNYNVVALSNCLIADETAGSENLYANAFTSKLFDITDISNQKFHLSTLANNDGNVKTRGDTDDTISHFTIMKLGDT